MTDEHKQVPQFEHRLSKVESLLESSVRSLENQIQVSNNSLSSQITQITTALQNVTNTYAAHTKTNWSTIVATASLVLAFLVALGQGFLRGPLMELSTRHYTAVAQTRDVTKTIKNNLYNLEKTTIAYESQDKAVTLYFREKTKDLEGRIGGVEKQIKKTDVTGAASKTSHEQRLQNLERLAFPEVKYREGKPN